MGDIIHNQLLVVAATERIVILILFLSASLLRFSFAVTAVEVDNLLGELDALRFHDICFIFGQLDQANLQLHASFSLFIADV